jgi:hypothetical protein
MAAVIERGREAEVLALFSPYRLTSELAPGWALWNVSISATAIDVELRGRAGAEARVTLVQEVEGELERSESFSIRRDDAARSGDARVAADALVTALRRNDRGGFWHASSAPAERDPAGRASEGPDQRARGLALPIGVAVASALAMWLFARRIRLASRAGRVAVLLPLIAIPALSSSAGCGGGGDDGGAGGGGAGSPGVHCADGALCNPGESCCVSLLAGTPSVCEVTCQTGSPFACDGPEDCGKNACCGDLVSGVACATTSECAAGVPQHCHGDQDCPKGERCLSVTYAGVPGNNCIEN